MSSIESLITDRTQEDVERAEYLNSLWVYDEAAGGLYWSGTTEELSEWSSDLKGTYNASDLNRVGSAVEYVAGRFADYGYSVDVSPRKDWSMGNIPREADMVKYLSEVEQLRSLVSVLPTTPETPGDMECLTVVEANNIEQILVDVDEVLETMITTFVPCGEAICGEDNL